MTSQSPLTLGAALVVLCALPFTTSNAYYLDIVVQVYMWAAAAVAWNLLGGYAGQFSLGHSAFFGIGAYTSSLLLLTAGLTPWIGMLAGGVLAALFALVIGYLAIRLRGPFFTLATIALAEVLQILAVYFRDLTGGSQGLSLPFAASVANFTFDGKRAYALAGLGFLLFALVIGYLAIRLRGPFFTLATIALAEVLQILAVYFRDLTGGSQGLSLRSPRAWRTSPSTASAPTRWRGSASSWWPSSSPSSSNGPGSATTSWRSARKRRPRARSASPCSGSS